MARKKFWLTLFIAVGIAVGARSVQAVEYHIGSGTVDGVTRFATLEALRIALAGNGQYEHLQNGDRVIIYRNDSSLTQELGIASMTGGIANVTVEFRSTDANNPIVLGTSAATRFFNMNYPDSLGSTLTFVGYGEMVGGRDRTSAGGGTIYAWWHNNIYSQGITYRDNFSSGVGGAIYYWDALDADLTDANFYNNLSGSNGGALYINASGTLTMTDTTNITLGATAGNTSTFSGNRDRVSVDVSGNPIAGTGEANSIDFTGFSGNKVNLYIKTEEGGTLDMQDPFRTNASASGSYTVNIIKSGEGTWKLGGDSIIDGSSGTTVSIQGGTLDLYQGAMLDARGTNDEFNISNGARIYVRGDNTLKGTRVLFESGAMLTFDLSYYPDFGQTVNMENMPMLYLSGNTLQVAGTRIDIAGLPALDPRREGDYVLIQGTSYLEVGDFDLWIGDANIDVSGKVSPRLGYSLGHRLDDLGNVVDDTQLVLTISATDNTVLRWDNDGESNQWNVVNKNWTLIRDNTVDSFIPADTVQFFGDENHSVVLTENVVIGHNSVTDVNGVTWYAGAGDLTGMHVDGAGNWIFTGSSINDSDTFGKAALLYTGTGSLTLANTAANAYSYNVLAGTGTLYVSRGDLLGTDAVQFASNGTTNETSKLHFTAATTLTSQLVAENGGNGLVTTANNSGVNLTVTRTAEETETLGGAVYVKNGGTLTVQANPRAISATNTSGRIVFQGNGTKENTTDPTTTQYLLGGGAAYVEHGGTLVLEKTEFLNNIAGYAGGAVSSMGTLKIVDNTFTGNFAGVGVTGYGGAIGLSGVSTTTITDSTFTDNLSSGYGGAIYYAATAANSSLTIGATAGNTTLFENNLSFAAYDSGTETWSGQRTAIHINGSGNQTARLVVDVEENGVVDMRDSIVAVSGANYTANITKIGEGTWKQAGSIHLAGNGNSLVSIQGGDLELYRADASLGIEAGSVTVLGTFEIRDGGTLNAMGGNTITATRVSLLEGSTLGFDLLRSSHNTGTILTIDATSGVYNFSNGKLNIDILNLSGIEDDGLGMFNLATFVGVEITDSIINNMTALYRGEDMSKFRQHLADLSGVYDGNDTILKINMYQTGNGLTQWTNAAGNSVWDATSLDWKGQGALDGTEQFLHGDAVLFTDQGAGRIEILAGGVVIADRTSTGGTVIPGMTVNSSADYTFYGGSISDTPSNPASVLKQGSGTLTFEQENSFTGGMTIQGGAVVGKKIGSFGSGNITLTNSTTVQFDVDESGTFAGAVTGDGSLVKSGNGALRLSNVGNDYSNGTTILGGMLISEGPSPFGTVGGIITGDETGSGIAGFDLNFGDGEVVFSRLISGTGMIRNMGETPLVLTQANTYSGGTINDSGASLIVTNVGALGRGNVANMGTLTFRLETGRNCEFNQLISGTGLLVKEGEAVLVLGAQNTYTGDTVIRGGTIRLESETAIRYSAVRLEGGTLSFGNLSSGVIGGLVGDDASANIALTGSDRQAFTLTLDVAANRDLTYAGSLTGIGQLIKDGAGTQTLTGENTYSGGTFIKAGRLVAGGASALGTADVVNDSELEFNITDEERYANRITGTGAVFKTGAGSIELTGVNTYAGGTFVGDGEVKVSTFEALGTGGIMLAGSTAALTAEINGEESTKQSISGTGTFNKTGTGSLFLEGDLKLTGITNVRTGSLFLNGSSASQTVVYAGATLGGNGRLNSDALFKSGSFHVVGHQSTGSLSRFTANNLAYESGSTIFIKVGMNGSDQIVAKDAINFAKGGGNVNVVLVNLGLGDFTDDAGNPTLYEVFVSESNRLLLDGISIQNQESDGDRITQDGVNASINFLAYPEEGIGVLGYSVKTNEDNSKSIFLNLSTFDDGAVAYLDGNQKNVLAGLGDADVFGQIYSLSRNVRGDTINYLMPYIQTAMPFVTQRAVTQFNLATFDRLRFLREPMAMKADDAEQYRGSSYRLAHIHGPSNYIWFQNYGDIMRMTAKGSVPAFQADAYGFSLGVDKGLGRHSAVGLGLGGNFSDIDANSVHQSGTANSFLISLYGSWVNDDNWMITGSTGFVFSSYKLERSADPFGTLLESRHDGTTIFASLEGSKKFLFGRYDLTPYAGLDFIWLCEEGYWERASGGNTNLALRVKSQDTFTVLSTVGVRLGRAMRLLGGNIVSPSIHAAWVHDWTESDIATRASFVDMPVFKVKGASMNRDRAQLGVNVDMTLNRRTDMFAKFNAEVAQRYSDLSFHWGIRLGF